MCFVVVELPAVFKYVCVIKLYTRIRPYTAVFGPPPSCPAPEISYTRYGRPRYPPVHEPSFGRLCPYPGRLAVLWAIAYRYVVFFLILILTCFLLSIYIDY